MDLRTHAFLDSLQPQYVGFLGTIAQDLLSLPNGTSPWVGNSPGLEINCITNIAVRCVRVRREQSNAARHC